MSKPYMMGSWVEIANTLKWNRGVKDSDVGRIGIIIARWVEDQWARPTWVYHFRPIEYTEDGQTVAYDALVVHDDQLIPSAPYLDPLWKELNSL